LFCVVFSVVVCVSDEFGRFVRVLYWRIKIYEYLGLGNSKLYEKIYRIVESYANKGKGGD
jgi:hypothetical protein